MNKTAVGGAKIEILYKDLLFLHPTFIYNTICIYMKMMSSAKFNQCFEVIPNNADGNCLFEALEYLLQDRISKYVTAADIPTAANIREMVGEFYRNFDKDIDYPEKTIEYNIKLGNLFDNIDEEMPHDYNIWNDKVWASMTDLLICCLLFEININLYKYSENTKTYCLEKIENQYDFPETINILYNGVNHFEAIVYKDL